jgi:mannose-6-phosphate isomerase-like protein (cupin superfamily)
VRTFRIENEMGFAVLYTTALSQGAKMVLAPGEGAGGEDTRDSDQWLLVISGEARAVVEGQSVKLLPGTMLLIEAGETHEIHNIGRAALVTFNIFAPPVYPAEGAS